LRKLWFRRKAVSSMIGGMIVLGLFLLALVAMVLTSQQYDAYQATVSNMAQRDVDRTSENLQPTYPGVRGGFPVAGCGGTCNQYNVSLANIGKVGVQIVQIYINSTRQTTVAKGVTYSGCTVNPTPSTNPKGPCVLGGQTTIKPYAFNTFDAYIMAGEANHVVRLWLPSIIVLPNASQTPSNTLWIVTSRGRVFSFQWPFPPAGQGVPGVGAPPTLYTGIMKVAYSGQHSYGGHQGTVTYSSQSSFAPSCHTDSRRQIPGPGGPPLYLVNSWVTDVVMGDVYALSTTLYVSAYATNSLSIPLTFSWGQMVILTADSTPNSKAYYVGGPLAGVVSNQTCPTCQEFDAAGTPVTIESNQDFYLIFQITYLNFGGGTPTFASPGDAFSGTATVNNGYGAQNPGVNFREVEVFLNGLFVMTTSGSTPSCTPS
jgi:hypothetical protein